jgi:hypothetical protein
VLRFKLHDYHFCADIYSHFIPRSSPPNVFIGGPVPNPPGFPPFEILRAVSTIERLKACGNDGLLIQGDREIDGDC